MSTTTYTRQELTLKTKEELRDICRSDRGKYYGFSSLTKGPLIEFILKGGLVTTNNRIIGGTRSRGARQRAQGQPLTQPISNPEPDEDDFSDLSEMFSENLGIYKREYDDYGIEEDSELFSAKPEFEEIDSFVNDGIIKIIKSLDPKSSVFYEHYENVDKSEMYSLYKKQLYRKYGKLGKEEILLHGTNECNIKEILENDFSLTINAKHGTAYGKGIYFTNNILKALDYSERDKKTKYVIMTRVYIGDIVPGTISMDIHPTMPNSDKRYDTSVDCPNNPIQFIKKNNNQYNIIGVMKINLSKSDVLKLKLNPLNSHLKIINKTSENITVYFSHTKFQMNNKPQGKYMGKLKPNSFGGYNTAYNHNFACFNRHGCIRLITITQLKTKIELTD
tara:strand:+ start:3592 stop:4764 length:1173 start_codon:yes stop_codon:yes gene_type:complete